MSGVEVVLGVLPLLISAAEHFHQVCRPFSRYRHFSQEVTRFQSSLRIQKTIFLNTSQLLLQHITDHEAASQLLNCKIPVDDQLKDALDQALGSSGEDCLNIVLNVQDILKNINNEKFMELDEEDASRPSRVMSEVDVVRRCWTKTKFSISKIRLEECLSSLRTFNDEFGTLAEQMHDLAKPRQRAVTRTIKLVSKDIRKYKSIQEASRQLYNALGRACTVHTEHDAHFCLEAEHTILSGKSPPQIVFSLALTHATSNSSASKGAPLWIEVESIAEDDLQRSESSFLPALKHIIEQQEVVAPPPPKRKKARKYVTFRSPSPPPTPQSVALPVTIRPNSSLPDLCKTGNLCTTIRASLTSSGDHQSRPSKKCIGILEKTPTYRQLVYSSMRYPPPVAPKPISLHDLITKFSVNDNASFGLSRCEKVRLARKLATAVLQYNSTPWLKRSWRSKDIYFFDALQPSNEKEPVKLIAPHFSRALSVDPTALLEDGDSKIQPFADNQILFGLGIVLLELSYESTLIQLQKPSDMAIAVIDQNHCEASSEFIQAKRLAASATVTRAMGPKYHRIVQKCLRCDFGCGSDFDSLSLQERFFRDVICELEVLEVKLRELDLDDEEIF